MEVLVGAQPGEGTSRGFLRDYEIFANLRITFVFKLYWLSVYRMCSSLHVSHLEVGMAHRHVSLQCQADGQQDRAWNKNIYVFSTINRWVTYLQDMR